MKLHDISYMISGHTAPWPGDREAKIERFSSSGINTSYVSFPSHFSTHVDAHSHFDSEAPSIDEISLEHFIGECQVIEVDTGLITVKDIKEDITTSIVIFKTSSSDISKGFNRNFTALDSSLVEFLGIKGVITVGIDTPSIDIFTSPDHPAHKMANAYRIIAIENLDLKNILPGYYELLSMPLKIEKGDGSPIRAVLREK